VRSVKKQPSGLFLASKSEARKRKDANLQSKLYPFERAKNLIGAFAPVRFFIFNKNKK
jgi:hypothetical protein